MRVTAPSAVPPSEAAEGDGNKHHTQRHRGQTDDAARLGGNAGHEPKQILEPPGKKGKHEALDYEDHSHAQKEREADAHVSTLTRRRRVQHTRLRPQAQLPGTAGWRPAEPSRYSKNSLSGEMTMLEFSRRSARSYAVIER